ncbi:PhnD/SsuA/transferrin family substrate-binding protein [Candidatus Bipolaricaulota bacterium]|nr:PhnD/SsuA/transferrin family substrate-binding protein [Candidatus Bipolaricaulota bacterium]
MWQKKAKFTFVLVLAVGLLSVGALSAELGTKKNPVQWLFPPSVDTAVIQDVGREVVEDIFELTGIYIEPHVTADYAALIEAVKAADGDTMATPTTDQYARLYVETNGGVHPRLAAVRYGSSYYFASVYALREEMDYHPDLEDALEALDGKKWIYSYPGSTSGYVLPKKVFDAHNVEIKDKLESGGHPNSIVALLEGRGDFATSYGSPPEPPKGVYFEWEYGDDPEMWVWNHYLDKLYPEEVRGKVKDVREAVGEGGMYTYDEVVNKVGIVTTFGPIPNDSITFTNDFPKEIEDKIVNAIIEHIRSPEGSKLWGDPNFYQWTDVERITDDYYDGYREMVGYPVPEE